MRQRLWLERRLEQRPKLKEAFYEGRLSFAKTVLLVRNTDLAPGGADDAEIVRKIEGAKQTTAQQLRREVKKEEKRQNREVGAVRL